jgi:hypothetical protein
LHNNNNIGFDIIEEKADEDYHNLVMHNIERGISSGSCAEYEEGI